MSQVSNEMTLVSSCDAVRCSYNLNNKCHAKAITIGDGVNPECDTFLSSFEHTHEVNQMAGVGACKVSDCVHNNEFECAADNVSIGIVDGEVKCLTFSARISDTQEIQDYPLA